MLPLPSNFYEEIICNIVTHYTFLFAAGLRRRSIKRFDVVEARSRSKLICVYGVTHVGDSRQFPLPAQVLRSLRRSEKYVTESASAFVKVSEVRAMLKEQYVPDRGGSLEELLAVPACRTEIGKPAIEDMLPAAYDRHNIKKLMKLSPRALVHQLSSPPAAQLPSASSTLGVTPIEHVLKAAADSHKIAHATLDPEYWTSIDALSPSAKCDLIKGLAQFYARPDRDVILWSQHDEIMNAWLKGDFASIAGLYLNSFTRLGPGNGVGFRTWFSKRNETMAELMISVEGKTVFVAIGAAHLGGEQGVLNILRARGFELRPR